MLEHMPAGASYRQLLHYMQIGFIGRFQKFDFGPEENQRLYGSIEPPEYNYSNIQTPLHILYGTNDYLVPAAVRKWNCNLHFKLYFKIILFLEHTDFAEKN